MILAILFCLDVLGLVTTIPALAAADTARQTTLAIGRIVGATSSAAMLLLVRQGRPRSALDAALAGIAVQVVQGVAIWILEGDPRFLALAALPCIFLSFVILGRRSVPRRCPGSSAGGVALDPEHGSLHRGAPNAGVGTTRTVSGIVETAPAFQRAWPGGSR